MAQLLSLIFIHWIPISIFWTTGASFARDVTAAILVVKNKSISLRWEMNSIFKGIIRKNWPPTWIYISTQEGFVYQARTSRSLFHCISYLSAVTFGKNYVYPFCKIWEEVTSSFCSLLLSHFYYAPQCVNSPSKRGCSVRASSLVSAEVHWLRH